MLKFEGIVSAIPTPFTKAGNINIESLHRLIDLQVNGGVHGLWVAGGGGEGILLSLQERKILAEAVVDCVNGRVTLFNHVGAIAMRDVIELANHSADIGFDAVSAIPPFWGRPKYKEVIQFYKTLAKAVNLPVFIYHVPHLTNVSIGINVMRELMIFKNIMGLKYSDYNLYELRRLVELDDGRFTVYSGFDEVLLPALIMGAKGGIGSTYPIMPNTFVKIFKAYNEKNYEEAKVHQYKINHVIEIIVRYGGIASVKAILKWMGIDCGQPRQLGQILSRAELKQLRKELDNLDFFGDYLSNY